MKIPNVRFKISHLPLLIFHLVFLWIALTNFPLNQYFLGWDALSPELNFPLNFARAFAASWQENYGLGVVAGHGFAATLPHTIISFLFSFVMPEWAIRTAFTLFCLYLGGLGMYFLVSRIVKTATKPVSGFGNVNRKTLNETGIVTDERLTTPTVSFIALASSLYYMLNLGTIQIFYAQLETFIGHYASLPWLFLIVLLLFEKITIKRLIFFFFINFFATLQGFIPSLFVAYTVALILFLAVICIKKENLGKNIRRVILIVFLTGAINSYWVLPLVYYQLTQNTTFLNSYNNLISTPHFIDINRKYGDLTNVAQIKGYLFDSFQLGDFILSPFITNFEKTVPTVIYLFSFLVIIFGFLMSIVKRQSRVLLGFSFVFVLFFASLSTNVFPFTIVTGILRELSPTYEQAFRTAFTKFSVGLSFSYSIFFGIGLFYLTTYVKQLRTITRASLIFWAVICISLIYASFPVFRGNLMYEKLFVTPPKQYKDVSEYFKSQPDGRIADLPQECSEGWFAYKWGYFGSGFYWYAVKQPILARTFDVWSKYNENYYWELTQAMRSQNFPQVENVFKKYDVRWILYDPNAYYCGNQAGTLTQERFIESLNTSVNYKKVKEFTSDIGSPIFLFERRVQPENSFVSEATNLPNVGPLYDFEDRDEGLETTYQTTSTEPFTLFIPFRSLFTKRSAFEREFELTSTTDHLIFENSLPENLAGYSLNLRDLVQAEKTIPVELSIQSQEKDTSLVILSFVFPEVSIGSQEIYQNIYSQPIGTIATTPPSQLIVTINSQEIKPINNLYKSTFFTDTPNTISLQTRNGATLLRFTSDEDILNRAYGQVPEAFILPEYNDRKITVEIPKIADQKLFGITQIQRQNLVPKPCNERTPSRKNQYEISGPQNDTVVRMTSQESSQCLTYTTSDALTSEGYVAEITTQHLTGNALRFSLVDSSETVLIDQYLLLDSGKITSQILIPPTNSFGIGYKMTLQNASESDTKTINDVYGINVWQIPYNFLSNLTFASPAKAQTATVTAPSAVAHPNETLYVVSPKTDSTQLILWQAFNDGWKAYRISNSLMQVVPFIFGEELKDKVIINNWANGWNLRNYPLDDNNYTLIIIFWPQYLQYAGFVLFGVAILVAIIVGKNSISRSRKQDDLPQS